MLYSFQDNGQDGNYPLSGLILDQAGNLYGTTELGGNGGCHQFAKVIGCGTVYELSPSSGGGWSQTVLYSFQFSPRDGAYPEPGLTFDKAGNLYGVTEAGGDGTGCKLYDNWHGCGTVLSSPKLGGGGQKPY